MQRALFLLGILSSIALPQAAGAETFAGADVVSDASLNDTRGTFLPVLVVSDQSAYFTNNNIVNPVSGDNIVGDGAFSNSPWSTAIMNTGSGVLIQNSTVVNATFIQ